LISINTGLQAGDHRTAHEKAVSTAFLTHPAQPMSLDELVELISKRAHLVMLLLSTCVGGDLIYI
jgi:hypothetical protein